MVTKSNSKKVLLPALLLKLHQDQMTGVVTAKDDQKAIKIHLKAGHVVFADGIDTDSRLLKEIATKKKLPPDQRKALEEIKEKDPQSLGKVLIEKQIISQSVWNKFLEIKVKQTLSAAIQMDKADLGFSETQPSTQPINLIDYNLIQLLMETIKGIKNVDHFKKHVSGENTALIRNPDGGTNGNLIPPLSPAEQDILEMVNGKRTVEDIIAAAGQEPMQVHRTLYLLFCFDLVGPLHAGDQNAGASAVNDIINLYLDIIKIIEAGLRREVGKQFDTIFQECREEVHQKGKSPLGRLGLDQDAEKLFREDVAKGAAGKDAAEYALMLKSSFNKLTYLLLLRMKKLLGLHMTEKAVDEMKSMLEYVEKYGQDKDMMNYVKRNLDDYLRQLKS